MLVSRFLVLVGLVWASTCAAYACEEGRFECQVGHLMQCQCAGTNCHWQITSQVCKSSSEQNFTPSKMNPFEVSYQAEK